jgi:hypothetical protein
MRRTCCAATFIEPVCQKTIANGASGPSDLFVFWPFPSSVLDIRLLESFGLRPTFEGLVQSIGPFARFARAAPPPVRALSPLDITFSCHQSTYTIFPCFVNISRSPCCHTSQLCFDVATAVEPCHPPTCSTYLLGTPSVLLAPIHLWSIRH